jgi:hypothetical protein
MTRHIDKLATDLEQNIRDRASKFQAFFLATDKSTDVSDTPQPAVLVHGVDAEFNVLG